MKEHYKHLAQAAALVGILGLSGKVAVDRITAPEPITTSESAPWQRLATVQRDVLAARKDLGEVPITTLAGYDIYQHPDPQAAREKIGEALTVLPEDSRQPWPLQSVAIDLQITKDTFDEDLAPQPTPAVSMPYSSYGGSYSSGSVPTWSSEQSWLDIINTDLKSAQIVYHKPK